MPHHLKLPFGQKLCYRQFAIAPSLFTVVVAIFCFTVDTTPPQVIGCPDRVIETIELGTQSVPVFWQLPTAFDLSEPPPVSVDSTFSPGDQFPPDETTVLYTFTDSSGNQATCDFIVQVNIGQ